MEVRYCMPIINLVLNFCIELCQLNLECSSFKELKDYNVLISNEVSKFC